MSQTEQLEKTSTPVYKWCSHCKEWTPRDGFYKNRATHDGLGDQCKLCASASAKAYSQTPQGREAYRRAGRKYRQTPKGIMWRKGYEQLPKRIMSNFIYNDKYCLTEKSRLRDERFSARHGGKATYKREHYHRIQDEAGCHCDIEDFYPAYRILKALQNAEVVNI